MPDECGMQRATDAWKKANTPYDLAKCIQVQGQKCGKGEECILRLHLKNGNWDAACVCGTKTVPAGKSNEKIRKTLAAVNAALKAAHGKKTSTLPEIKDENPTGGPCDLTVYSVNVDEAADFSVYIVCSASKAKEQCDDGTSCTPAYWIEKSAIIHLRCFCASAKDTRP